MDEVECDQQNSPIRAHLRSMFCWCCALMGSYVVTGLRGACAVWQTAERAAPEDWAEWLRSLSINLLQHSPSPALRPCTPSARAIPVRSPPAYLV